MSLIDYVYILSVILLRFNRMIRIMPNIILILKTFFNYKNDGCYFIALALFFHGMGNYYDYNTFLRTILFMFGNILLNVDFMLNNYLTYYDKDNKTAKERQYKWILFDKNLLAFPLIGTVICSLFIFCYSYNYSNYVLFSIYTFSLIVTFCQSLTLFKRDNTKIAFFILSIAEIVYICQHLNLSIWLFTDGYLYTILYYTAIYALTSSL